GGWKWNDQTVHEGKHSLILNEKATAQQTYHGAVYQEGGGAWAAAPTKPITLANPDRFPQPWRATVWCRGGGTIKLGPVSAKASGGSQWEQVAITCPAEQVPKDDT